MKYVVDVDERIWMQDKFLMMKVGNGALWESNKRLVTLKMELV